ncbi:MAG: isoleucine--tRNA ligase [Acidimicrobiia bacterium]
MPFAAVDSNLDLPALEAAVLTRWSADDTFAESLRRRAGAPAWVFYEGPPTANGRPGIHHVWARLFKDLYPRFHTMRNRYVARRAGWDCHGLPVEVEVEKELGFSGKQQIEAYGIAAFNRRCRESVQRYVGDFEALTKRIGMWLDTDDAYWTMSNEFVESVWWCFAQMFARGDIEEGHKVVPYCARCGTALSSHELGQPGAYRDVTEESVYVRFPVDGADFDLLVWTTTPWTLPSNTAVALGPALEYVRVRRADRDVVMAASRVEAVLGPDAEVVSRIDASALVGVRYLPPFDFLGPPSGGDAFVVVTDDFVTADDGSGIVHLAPAFGEIDREVAARAGLGVINPVGADGAFDATMPEPYAGRFVKDTDPDLIAALRASGRLEEIEPYTHSYPHCWRCGTALIYWAKPTWFARTARHRDELLRENDAIGWHPDHIKRGRFGDWLEHNVDWALSRDRFWGTPLPVWRCGECGHDACVGSVAELSALAGRPLDDLDLHRPYVDEVILACPACGGEARRVEPVLDAWFDSGAMPSAQQHYPFAPEFADEATRAARFEEQFPADFICEAIDQTRGWFYSLLAVNTLVFERSPYRNVVCLAHVVDQDGQKMSKSKGNVIDPWTVLDTRGADALRWYFFSAGSPWTPRRVFVDGIDESTRRFLLTLWNTYSFAVTYANLDRWEPAPPGASAPPPTHVLDRWIRSRVHSTIGEVTDALEHFDALRGAHALEQLVDDLSNWYVRRSRPRFWRSADPAAHATLHESLTTVVLLLAPFCPFVADEIWSNLVAGAGSVHLADWPDADERAVGHALEAEMAAARQVVTLGRAARTEAKVKVRQPLPRALVLVPGVTWTPEVVAEIADELNVKQVETVHDLEGLLDYSVVPNFRRLGPRLGSLVPKVREQLAGADGAAIRRQLQLEGRFTLEVDGEAVVIEPDDVEIRASAHEELAVVQDGASAIALDTTIDAELRREGLARELVRAINDLRKARDLALADRIHVTVGATGAVLDAALHHGEWIAGEVLATAWAVLDRSSSESATGSSEAGEAVGSTVLHLDAAEVVVTITAVDRAVDRRADRAAQ